MSVEKVKKRPATEPLVNTCATCKAFGSQGMGFRQELEGDWRWCAIATFGDCEADCVLMPRWEVTYGSAGSSKGRLTVHKDFGCINHNAKYEEC